MSARAARARGREAARSQAAKSRVRRSARGARRPARLLVYGASGYTGALIARAAVARDVPIVLAGRDAARLAPVAAELASSYRVVALDREEDLRVALDGVSVVVNTAGPFENTACRLASACLAAGIHYLDISGEPDAIEAVQKLDRAARAARVMLMPAAGFDVVPSDCLALRVRRRLPQAQRLRIGLAGLNLMSRGSARTIVEQLGRGVRIRREGRLMTIRDGSLRTTFDFGAGSRSCIGVSWGDVVTAYHTTRIPNVEVYFDATLPVRAFQTFGQTLASFPPAQAMARMWLAPWLEIQPAGPGPGERERQRAVIVALAESADGRCVASRAHTPDVYSFTASCAVELATRVLRGELEPGFRTPAAVFGAELIDSFSDVVVEDLTAPVAGGEARP